LLHTKRGRRKPLTGSVGGKNGRRWFPTARCASILVEKRKGKKIGKRTLRQKRERWRYAYQPGDISDNNVGERRKRWCVLQGKTAKEGARPCHTKGERLTSFSRGWMKKGGKAG